MDEDFKISLLINCSEIPNNWIGTIYLRVDAEKNWKENKGIKETKAITSLNRAKEFLTLMEGILSKPN